MIVERYTGGVRLLDLIYEPRPLLPETAETSMENVRDCTMVTKSSPALRVVAATITELDKTEKHASAVNKSENKKKDKKAGSNPTEVKEGSVSLAAALRVVSCPLCSQWMMSPYRLMDMDTGIICCSNCALLVYQKDLSSKKGNSSYLYYDANYFYPYRRLNELPKKKKAQKEKVNESKS